jgi:hypothetical protein
LRGSLSRFVKVADVRNVEKPLEGVEGLRRVKGIPRCGGEGETFKTLKVGYPSVQVLGP